MKAKYKIKPLNEQNTIKNRLFSEFICLRPDKNFKFHLHCLFYKNK